MSVLNERSECVFGKFYDEEIDGWWTKLPFLT